MFVYLSKRIAIPNGVTITSIGWNEEQGWLATGGAGGLLKVLKVDGGQQGRKSGGLSLNQTLEGHEHDVTHVAWNHRCRKLTSSDTSGRIIVWTLHKGMWFEEMVNNRQASHVVDLMWSADGSRVCIAYADGAVIVGNVDGNRLWGQNFDYQLARVCWSANDRYLIFGTVSGEVYVHDAEAGQLVSRVNVVAEEAAANAPSTAGEPERLVGLSWHPAWVDRPEPLSTFAICFDSGRLQLMHSIGDDNPYLVDTGIRVQYIAWNPQGTVIALTGRSADAASEHSVIITQFYSNEAIHLRSLRVPGQRCGGVTWESDGLRIAIAVDSSVYFANIRPHYRYCYFSDTLVYTFTRRDKVEDTVTFWNVKTNERWSKPVRHLLFLDACLDACAMVSKPSRTRQPCMVQLLSAIGSPLETKFVPFEPYVCAMNSSHVICCGEESIYLWRFRDPAGVVDALDPVSVQVSRRASHERVVHVEDVVHAETAESPDADTGGGATAVRSALTNDLICAVCASELGLVVGRESGMVHVYRLVPLQLRSKLLLPARPQSMAINSDSTMLSVIDLAGHMRVYGLDLGYTSLIPRKAEPAGGGAAAAAAGGGGVWGERKDVWNMRWAADHPALLAVMEKTRMILLRPLVPEEPVPSNANLCQFRGLEVLAVQLDELTADPERPRKESVMVTFEARELRALRAAMARPSCTVAAVVRDAEEMTAAATVATATVAAAVWPRVAEFALSRLAFGFAEAAFVRVRDYAAVRFVARVRAMDETTKQLAEVAAYYGHVDEAERRYKETDRKDLALELRYRRGDWFAVVRLVQEGGGDESVMYDAWEKIGDHYAERHRWNKAIQYYTQGKNYAKLARVFYVTEDFEMLAQLVDLAAPDAALLRRIAAMFVTVGLADEAARAFVAAGEPRRAVAACVALHRWESAMGVAAAHAAAAVEPLVRRYARDLVAHDRLADALELHRHAGQHDEAARLLRLLGRRVGGRGDALRAKKFYVLAALEARRQRQRQRQRGDGDGDGAGAVEEWLVEDRRYADELDGGGGGGGGAAPDGSWALSDDRLWRGAEAYHFFLYCQANILDKNLHTAFVLAMRLTEYDDLIALVDVYRLVALTAYLVENYGLCSAAFTRLEAAERAGEEAAGAAARGGGAAGAAGGISLPDFPLDLDVTQRRPAAAATARRAESHALDGTTMAASSTAMAVAPTAAAGDGLLAFTYPTVRVDEPECRFANLAAQIFTRHLPVDSSVKSVPCPTCGAFNSEWSSRCGECHQSFRVCIVSGRAIVSDEDVWQCHVCQHGAVEMEMERFKNCPLCHSPKKTRLRQAI